MCKKIWELILISAYIGHIDIPRCTQITIIHCNTNDMGQNKPIGITTGIMEIASTLLKKNSKIKIVLTDILPQGRYWLLC